MDGRCRDVNGKPKTGQGAFSLDAGGKPRGVFEVHVFDRPCEDQPAGGKHEPVVSDLDLLCQFPQNRLVVESGLGWVDGSVYPFGCLMEDGQERIESQIDAR